MMDLAHREPLSPTGTGPPPAHANVFLENGARLYLDTGFHPEYATPECDDVAELVSHRQLPPYIAAQAPERSGETRGKCPEKARSRSGHALVASWSCTGSCGLSMTTSTPESADDFDQVHLQPHARLPVPLLRPHAVERLRPTPGQRFAHLRSKAVYEDEARESPTKATKPRGGAVCRRGYVRASGRLGAGWGARGEVRRRGAEG